MRRVAITDLKTVWKNIGSRMGPKNDKEAGGQEQLDGGAKRRV